MGRPSRTRQMMLQAFRNMFLEGIWLVHLPLLDNRLLLGSVLLLGHLVDLVLMCLQDSSNRPYSLHLVLRGHFLGSICQQDSWKVLKHQKDKYFLKGNEPLHSRLTQQGKNNQLDKALLLSTVPLQRSRHQLGKYCMPLRLVQQRSFLEHKESG